MIRFEHVIRHYGDPESPALNDISIEFQRGDFVFLIGASGSGKSTLLRMILRESLPQQGRITVAGQNLGLMLERRVPEYRRSIGMVFQDFRLLPDKTVYDNVAFAMRVIGASRPTIRQRVMKILARVELKDLAKRYPHEISGGEQQRAAIARAIVNSPAIILADEPTGNLDPRASEEVMKILRWINASGTTVIMATHDRPIVDRMGRRVVQLHKGQLVRDDAHGLYDPPEGSRAWNILATEEAATGLRATDPLPQRAEPEPAPESDAEEPAATKPVQEPANEPAKVSHYQVSWPQEPASVSAEEPHIHPRVDAADLPEFHQVHQAAQEAPDLPDDAEGEPRAESVLDSAEPDTDPINTVTPRQQVELKPPAPVSSPPGPDPGSVPRPKASAGEATYSDSQRTAEQINSSKGGFFGRKRRRT